MAQSQPQIYRAKVGFAEGQASTVYIGRQQYWMNVTFADSCVCWHNKPKHVQPSPADLSRLEVAVQPG